ncbi:polyamine oxidase 7-like [Miscanthus floridulus]|uniref:polyamine oxidase 7-like n=1 Tax=Miscanthus floridulus TaxID=154761 RepID=UPI0034584D4F
MKTSSLVVVALAAVVLFAAQYASLADASSSSPRVIIVGAGMSGISAGKQLWESGVRDLLFLEATERVGGRMHKHNFGGLNVEIGANWVEGLGGDNLNPIWPIVNNTLNLRTFLSDFDSVVGCVYKENGGGLYDEEYVQKKMDRAYEVQEQGANLTKQMRPSGQDDISLLAMQRLFNHQPNGPATPVDMALDYFIYDYEFAEPPRVTSLQNTQPTPTNADFGEDNYFVADQRGFESIIHSIGSSYLSTDGNGKLSDRRILLNKVVRQIAYNKQGVVVKTEDGSSYSADYVVVSTSLGVLQTDLIKFTPQLPFWKIAAIYRFDMGAYTKIFLKFPTKFWPVGEGKQFFVYASSRRGYYGMWQSFEREYPGANVLLVTVTDDESRRIEQQSDNHTKAEVAEVLRDMFPDADVPAPDEIDIFVPRWWSNRFFKGSYSNWPIGVSRYEYDQLRAPVGRVYFTGEHTSERYNGYVHGAYLAGIDSANILINRIFKNEEYKVRGKYEYDDLIAEAK